MTLTIYHGNPSPNSIESCRDAAPSYTHGAEWALQKMTPHDWPYILDNGAFTAYKNNTLWDVDQFVRRLSQIEDEMPREPDFVVLPDVVTDPEGTYDRAEPWKSLIDYNTAFAVQDGMRPERAAEFAAEIGCVALFVGGTVRWKRTHAPTIVERAHDYGLDCHIARPGNIGWAEEIGADSVDTTSIVHNQNWGRLEHLENQQTFADVTSNIERTAE